MCLWAAQRFSAAIKSHSTTPVIHNRAESPVRNLLFHRDEWPTSRVHLGKKYLARMEPFDLLRALIGVSHVASGPDWQQSARRLVDIRITGSRPIK